MNAAVVVFPGSNCDADTLHVLGNVVGMNARYAWHADTSLEDADLVVLPGGFSYGDYLRTGAMAARAPIMAAVSEHAALGRPVLGICNGFQILLEAGLLPGAMLSNASTQFRCEWSHLPRGIHADALHGRGRVWPGASTAHRARRRQLRHQ